MFHGAPLFLFFCFFSLQFLPIISLSPTRSRRVTKSVCCSGKSPLRCHVADRHSIAAATATTTPPPPPDSTSTRAAHRPRMAADPHTRPPPSALIFLSSHSRRLQRAPAIPARSCAARGTRRRRTPRAPERQECLRTGTPRRRCELPWEVGRGERSGAGWGFLWARARSSRLF